MLQTILRELSRERRPDAAEERAYEVPFDKRAMDAVLDAINAGILPAMKVTTCVLQCDGLGPLVCVFRWLQIPTNCLTQALGLIGSHVLWFVS